MDGQRVLEIILSARDEASKKIEEVGDKVGKTGSMVEKMAGNFRIAGGVMIGAGVAGAATMLDWANSAAEAKAEMTKVEVLLENTAKAIDDQSMSFEKLKEVTDQVSQSYIRLGFDDETTAASFARLLNVTKDTGEAQKVLALSADLARAKNIDLSDATQAIIMALMGNTKLLKQYGTQLKDNATKTEILTALTDILGGTAEKRSKDYDIAMQAMAVSIGNLKEQLGERLLPTMVQFADHITAVITKINEIDPRVLDLIVKVTAIGTAFGLVVGPILLLIGFLPALSAGFAMLHLSMLPVLAVIAGAVLVVTLLYLAWSTNFLGIQQIVGSVVSFIINTLPAGFMAAVNWSIEALGTLLGAVSNIFNNIKNTMTNAINSAITSIMGSITGLIKNIYDIKDRVIKAFQDMVSPIVAILQQIKFPHVSIGEGKANIAGHEVKYPTFNVSWYEKGGYVPNTGLAMLHAGEFVMSKDMLSGRRAPPSDVSRTFNQPITINAVVGSGTDINMLGYQLAWILRNSR